MSVGQDFDPSLLERKDRAELVAIATTLGGKVPARLKKADVVAMILELAGVSAGGGAPDEASARAGVPGVTCRAGSVTPAHHGQRRESRGLAPEP